MKYRNFLFFVIAFTTCLKFSGVVSGDEAVCRHGASLFPTPVTGKPGR